MSETTETVNFQDYIASERERLAEERRRATSDIAAGQSWLAAIDREFAAIDAYEDAKKGKGVGGRIQTTVSRARRGSRREAILQAVQAAPNGMSRGELLEAFGLKGDKSGEMSISNALTALTKSGQLEREGGKYFAPVGRGDTVSALREAAE